MIFTTDDVYPSNLKYFKYWDMVKEAHPDLKLICFTVAKYNNDDNEDVSKSKEFREWYEIRKNWIEIHPHGLTHGLPQLGWISYDEQKERIKESIKILKPYLSEKIIYRFPGFRTMAYSEKILKECNIAGIAHREFIKYFDTGELFGPLLNTHCCDQFDKPITKIWKTLVK